MLRTAMACVLVAVGLMACATVPARHPMTEAKLGEAHVDLDALNQDVIAFYADLEDVLASIASLHEEPGWGAMQDILKETPSTAFLETDPQTDPRTASAVAAWSRQWNRPWEDLYLRYVLLVERCSTLEVRRFLLLTRLREVQAKYTTATVLELWSGRKAQAGSIDSLIDVLNEYENELSSYSIDAVGLYEVRRGSGRHPARRGVPHWGAAVPGTLIGTLFQRDKT